MMTAWTRGKAVSRYLAQGKQGEAAAAAYAAVNADEDERAVMMMRFG